MNKKYTLGQIIFALTVGFLAATSVYFSSTSPDITIQRESEEAVIKQSEKLFMTILQMPNTTQIIHPLNPDRDVGKSYIYPLDGDWQISGFYRRNQNEEWRAWLINLDNSLKLIDLRVQGLISEFDEDVLKKENVIILP
tara:strand:+ start:84 stop:500 length:417 start_codon:yes stop_codon:yes gene_type:complete